jgi:hypothetical protein
MHHAAMCFSSVVGLAAAVLRLLLSAWMLMHLGAFPSMVVEVARQLENAPLHTGLPSFGC